MRRQQIVCLGMVALLSGLVSVNPATAGQLTFAALEPDGFEAAFELDGSNGYSIYVDAFSARADGNGRINLFAFRPGHDASYTAPAKVTPEAIHADLGPLGKIDAVLHPNGHKKTVHLCGSGGPFTFEPGSYRGILEFEGEEGYTRAAQGSAPLRPFAFFGPPGCSGGGSGEELGSPELPGARLRGLSFAHGRTLAFQLNKNRPGGRMHFSASLRERRGEVLIHRDVKGVAPASAFTFERSLGAVALTPPLPFVGRAWLSRDQNSVSPILRGDLTIDFPGRSAVALAGPSVHVSLVHARYTRNRGPHAHI